VTIVDPLLVPIPKDFLARKDHREFFERLIRTVDQLRQRTGGASDEVTENSTRESYPWIIDDPESEQINLISESKTEENHYHYETVLREFIGVTVNTPFYTAIPWEWLNVKVGYIYLPQYPSDGDEVIVRNGHGGSVEINPNGKKINDEDFFIIYRKGSSVRLKYFLDDNQWFGV